MRGGFEWWINPFLQDGAAYPLFVPVFRKVALPHATPIAFLIAYGELAIGLALVLGIFVRAGSAFGLAYYIYVASLLKFSRAPGSILAVLRRLPRPFRLWFLLPGVHPGAERYMSFGQDGFVRLLERVSFLSRLYA